jgi:cell wall-associated NlpC family hydrolase
MAFIYAGNDPLSSTLRNPRYHLLGVECRRFDGGSMASPIGSPGLPSELYTVRTFFTLGGASTGVWIFSAVCGNFISSNHLGWLRVLALVMALVISLAGATREKGLAWHELLVALFNGLLIYVSATGINAVSTGTDFGLRARTASFLPLREQALWPSVELIQQKEALQREGAIQNEVLQLQREGAIQNEVLQLPRERDMLKPEPKPKIEQTLDEARMARILASATGKQREVLTLAFKLHGQKVPYKWGGKDPHDGFDSSGYIAYLLAKAGVIDDPTTYWSGKLLASPLLQTVPHEEVGDIIFYNAGACMIYLGDNTSIGMLPGGIVIDNLDESPEGYDRKGVRRY